MPVPTLLRARGRVKLALVTQSYYPRFGGVTEHVAHSARELRARGHEVTIVTGRPPGYRATDPEGVVRLGTSIMVPFQGAFVDLTLGPALRRDLTALWRERTFDLVHVHQPLTPTLPLLTGETATVPVIGTFHAAGAQSRLFRLFRRPLTRHFERLSGRVAVSPTARRFAGHHFPGDYRVIPNGVDVQRFHPDVPPRPELVDGRLNVLFVGRLDPRKGLPVLLEALPALRTTVPEARLVVVGDSFLRGWFEARLSAREREHVIFAGSVTPEALPSYYASAHAFVSPATRNESFGIVLLEAMAAGKALIASDIPGYRAVVDDGVDGLLVPPGDARALAGALGRLLRDPARRLALGARGRAKAETLGWPSVTGRLEEYYREVLAGRAHAS
ncbi:MAG: glycosyltransferase family 4 protein [Candidatus Eisenbacteria bacterium]